jgi:hypothetical protein
MQDMINRLRAAIHDSEVAGPKHGVIITQTDAKRLLYRLIKESQTPKVLVYKEHYGK